MTFFIDLDDTLFDCEKLKAAGVKSVSRRIRPIQYWDEVSQFTKEEQDKAEELLLEAIKDIKPYPEMIAWIKQNQPAFLITRGIQERQQAKIDALGIADLFQEIVITHNKEEAFRHLLKKHNLDPSKVLVVGDKSHDELRTGKNLGMKVKLVMDGEFI